MMDTIKIDKKQVKMVAHRGLSGIETENSNCAFTAAGNRSHFGIETDVHRTLDGEYIIIHDDNTGRVSEEALSVEGSNFADLRKVHLKDREDGVTRADLILPTLDDYIKICKRYGKKCILELKNPMSFEDAENIVNIIKKRDYVENVIFISFDYNNLLNIRKILPSVEQKIQFLCGPVDDAQIASMKENHIDVDIHYPTLMGMDELMPKFKAAGLEVNCWTVDSKEDAEKLVEMGVDYITSNILE